MCGFERVYIYILCLEKTVDLYLSQSTFEDDYVVLCVKHQTDFTRDLN